MDSGEAALRLEAALERANSELRGRVFKLVDRPDAARLLEDAWARVAERAFTEMAGVLVGAVRRVTGRRVEAKIDGYRLDAARGFVAAIYRLVGESGEEIGGAVVYAGLDAMYGSLEVKYCPAVHAEVEAFGWESDREVESEISYGQTECRTLVGPRDYERVLSGRARGRVHWMLEQAERAIEAAVRDQFGGTVRVELEEAGVEGSELRAEYSVLATAGGGAVVEARLALWAHLYAMFNGEVYAEPKALEITEFAATVH